MASQIVRFDEPAPPATFNLFLQQALAEGATRKAEARVEGRQIARESRALQAQDFQQAVDTIRNQRYEFEDPNDQMEFTTQATTNLQLSYPGAFNQRFNSTKQALAAVSRPLSLEELNAYKSRRDIERMSSKERKTYFSNVRKAKNAAASQTIIKHEALLNRHTQLQDMLREGKIYPGQSAKERREIFFQASLKSKDPSVWEKLRSGEETIQRIDAQLAATQRAARTQLEKNRSEIRTRMERVRLRKTPTKKRPTQARDMYILLNQERAVTKALNKYTGNPDAPVPYTAEAEYVYIPKTNIKRQTDGTLVIDEPATFFYSQYGKVKPQPATDYITLREFQVLQREASQKRRGQTNVPVGGGGPAPGVSPATNNAAGVPPAAKAPVGAATNNARGAQAVGASPEQGTQVADPMKYPAVSATNQESAAGLATSTQSSTVARTDDGAGMEAKARSLAPLFRAARNDPVMSMDGEANATLLERLSKIHAPHELVSLRDYYIALKKRHGALTTEQDTFFSDLSQFLTKNFTRLVALQRDRDVKLELE